MLSNYFPVLMFVLVGIAMGVLPMTIGMLLGPRKPDSEKLSAYECGFPTAGDARMKFDVRFYLIAIIFILFDLEIAFLFPWAAVFPDIAASEGFKWFGFLQVVVFLAILLIGDAYAWAKGALDWE
ncbi:MAG: NADH-quinone oxidoreductase subunit A [Zoogloeaceae bacterium]|jgi:NADH-quinone oxidoreductase subunit A|nr:NADH-quinone oxidoreductase subunit A [Zoogloeaceae bacterium]